MHPDDFRDEDDGPEWPSDAPGLPIDEPEDEGGPEGDDEDEGDEPRTVLITGASGNIGRKLRAAWEDIYELILIDLAAEPGDDEVYAADLAEWSEEWADLFEGVDTVVHLAGNPDESAPWDALEGPNLDGLFNVCLAAAQAGVERIVFASSNHAMGNYRDLGDMPITVDLPPKPDGPYGGTKLMGERLGRSLAAAFGLEFVALRLGWVQGGANRPETLPDDWSRGLWLSNADCVRLFGCAVEADLGGRPFVVVNGMSRNRGTRWDLAEAAERLGYEPEDDAEAAESWS